MTIRSVIWRNFVRLFGAILFGHLAILVVQSYNPQWKFLSDRIFQIICKDV